ncbi:cell surface protein [Methanosarcina sp. MSH10X1]|uniref:right-handed parallel beta-helix repeat-containing protein n=1 Tax=Methanosarcina sp. MSH10X1 TaxID=2507075 RepID=UPI000FFB88C7|nr:NosD domain-containing protein [Methanosarcina sp. MSH10X1]RXA19481.1 cell surface protein [Methanosarcina sp. MSH10X1]
MLIGDCSNRRRFSAALVVVLFLFSAGIGSAEVIYVEPGNSIQAAVNNSTSEDIVIVKAGEYQENIIVNVSGLTISSEFESPDHVLLRAKDGNSSIFQVKADNVTISGFNITGPGKLPGVPEPSNSVNSSVAVNNSSGPGDTGENQSSGQASNSGSNTSVYEWDEIGCPPAGICLEQVNNCTIENNTFFENRYGIYLQNSRNVTLLKNTFFRNGIWLDEGCGRNLLINNTIEESNLVLGAHCWDNIMFQNRVSNGDGISIACCGGNNLVSRNEIINCSTGIDIYDVQARTVLRDNLITGCGNGIYLTFVFDSRVYNNTISNSSTGIFLREDCHDNELSNNTIIANNESGIYLLDYSADNRIYNNCFNNSINVRTENAEGNIWNTTRSPATNIVGGPSLGGNFWANPEGTGFSQVSNDSDSDGICDLPFNINGSDFDYFPLARPPSVIGVDLTVIIGMPETNNTSDVSIEVDRSALDFGTLLSGQPAGQSGKPQVLQVRNTGKGNVNLSAEVRDSSGTVFSEGIYISSLFWSNFSEVIPANSSKDFEIVLKVPANYSGNGTEKGSLVFLAKQV